MTEFANIAGAMLLACVTTSSRFVNRALADANLRFRDIAASTAELLWESDENDCFTYCSSDTHLHATHMVGRRIKEIFAPTAEEYQINQAAWDKRDQAMMERRPFRMIEFHVMGEDGQREIMSVSGIPVLDDNNQFRGYRGATNNITSKHGEMALQSAKAAAEAATRAKSAFLAHMSHEIRTPLTAILGFAESLIDCEQPAADRSLAIHTIIRNGRHLTSLISDILDFSKIESERIEIEKIPIPFLNLLSDIHALGLGQAKDKGLEFSVHYLPPLPAVVTSDPTRIKQILINLIGNAVKFTPAPGAVRLIVSLDVENAQMLFSIQDTGIGISAMERQSLFEPFVQADISTTRSFGGTGLGLAISRGLARRLGGDIRIISDKDQGSLFVVTLPTGSLEGIALIHGSDGFDTDSHLVQVVLRAPCLAGRVLVAEDNPDNQRLISWLIRRTGASVVLVGNGQEAVERAQNEDFDLVLMDVQMPVMGGLDATELLRLTGFDHPIVALTANTAESDKTQALEAGCDGFLSKPIDQADFFATLSCHLPKGDGPTTESTAIFANPSDLKDDPEFQQMRERFTRELPGQLRDIAAACQGQDWPGVSSLAHRLKGVAASFDMPEATRIAGAIEFQILHGDYNQAGHLVLELVALCPRHP
ncbi:MAG: response regulator [Pseudomonadota bacterium]